MVPFEVLANGGSGREAQQLHQLLAVDERLEVPHPVQVQLLLHLVAELVQSGQRTLYTLVLQRNCPVCGGEWCACACACAVVNVRVRVRRCE